MTIGFDVVSHHLQVENIATPAPLPFWGGVALSRQKLGFNYLRLSMHRNPQIGTGDNQILYKIF